MRRPIKSAHGLCAGGVQGEDRNLSYGCHAHRCFALKVADNTRERRRYCPIALLLRTSIYIRSVCGREPFLSAAVRRVGIFAAEVMPTFGSSGGAASCQLTALFLSKFLGDCECFLWQIVQQQVAYCEVKPPDHVPIDGFDTFQRALRTPANRAPGALGFACLQGKLRTTSSTSTHTRRLRTWTLPAWRKSRMLSANLESNWRKRRTFSRRWGGYCTWGRSVPFVVRSRRCFGLRIAFFTAHFVRLTSWIHGKP